MQGLEEDDIERKETAAFSQGYSVVCGRLSHKQFILDFFVRWDCKNKHKDGISDVLIGIKKVRYQEHCNN